MFEDFTGLVLGQRYEIQSPLGSGGMALVFVAHDRKVDRQVAIKFVKPEYAQSSDTINALVEEVRIIARLEHPNILSVYDQGTQTVRGQRLVYFVMQLAGSDSLKRRIKDSGALPLNEAADILKQVCEALDHAHNHGVIHLDLKPANILFDEHGNALVADFGLAKLLQGASRVKADTGFGTPIYMPPEQFFGHKAGPFSDAYALGVTLYHMLTGELPEPEWSDPSLRLRLDHPLPPGIRSVIEKATQPDPDQRYRTAGELARAFTAAMASQEPRETPSAGKRAHVHTPAQDRARQRQSSVGALVKYWKEILAAVGFIAASVSCVATVIVVPEVRHMLGLESSPTPSVLPAASQAATRAPTPTLTPPPTTPAPTTSPTPYFVVSVERLGVYAGPGKDYDMWGQVQRGDRLPLRGRSTDGTWWQVDYLGRRGWVRAQGVGANVEPTILPTAKTPPPPPETPTPTQEATPSPQPNTVLRLQNSSFERVRENFIPGWQWWAADNYSPGGEYDPGTSFDTPFLSRTDDPARMINGATLQIEATAFVKLKIHVFQTVNAPPTVTVRFQVLAAAYSDLGGLKLAAGIDPDGGPDCSQARWGEVLTLDQSGGRVKLIAPDVAVGDAGRATVCLYAEAIYPARSNAVFFDDAALIANPE